MTTVSGYPTMDKVATYVGLLQAEVTQARAEMDEADQVRFDRQATAGTRRIALDRSRHLAARIDGLEYALAALVDAGLAYD